MDSAAPHSNVQPNTIFIPPVIHADYENGRLVFRSTWGTIFRSHPPPAHISITRPFEGYVEYQNESNRADQLPQVTDPSVDRLPIEHSVYESLHGATLARHAGVDQPAYWLFVPRGVEQPNTARRGEGLGAATAPSVPNASDGFTAAIPRGSSPTHSLTPEWVLGIRTPSPATLGALGARLPGHRPQASHGAQHQPTPSFAPLFAPLPPPRRNRFTAPSSSTSRSASRSDQSSGESGSSSNYPVGTTNTEASTASLASLRSTETGSSTGSPLVMESWTINSDSPAASTIQHPIQTPREQQLLRAVVDSDMPHAEQQIFPALTPREQQFLQVMRERQHASDVAFSNGVRDMMDPTGRTEAQRQHHQAEIERLSLEMDARRLEEQQSNREAFGQLPMAYNVGGPSGFAQQQQQRRRRRLDGNEGDDEEDSSSSKETTSTGSEIDTGSDKENKGKDEEERHQRLGPSGTIKGRKGKERRFSDRDDEGSSAGGKRRCSLPSWGQQQ